MDDIVQHEPIGLYRRIELPVSTLSDSSVGRQDIIDGRVEGTLKTIVMVLGIVLG